MLCTKFRNIDGYEIMSRKQLETILSTSYFPKPAPKPIQPTPKITVPAPKLKKPTPKSLHQLQDPRSKYLQPKKIESDFNYNIKVKALKN